MNFIIFLRDFSLTIFMTGIIFGPNRLDQEEVSRRVCPEPTVPRSERRCQISCLIFEYSKLKTPNFYTKWNLKKGNLGDNDAEGNFHSHSPISRESKINGVQFDISSYFLTKTGGSEMQNIFDVEGGTFVDCFYLHCNGIVFVHFVHSSQ